MKYETSGVHTIPGLRDDLNPIVDEFTRRFPDLEITRHDVYQFGQTVAEQLPDVSDAITEVIEGHELDQPMAIFDSIIRRANTESHN